MTPLSQILAGWDEDDGDSWVDKVTLRSWNQWKIRCVKGSGCWVQDKWVRCVCDVILSCALTDLYWYTGGDSVFIATTQGKLYICIESPIARIGTQIRNLRIFSCGVSNSRRRAITSAKHLDGILPITTLLLLDLFRSRVRNI